jgi:WD40 repeat protein
MSKPLPIAVLAFANNYSDPGQHLVHLRSERRELERIFQASPHCEYLVWDGLSLDELVSRLSQPHLRQRLAIFHYAGHAGSRELVLEDAQGQASTAFAMGIVPLLSNLPALKFAFFNGCSSGDLARGLAQAGIPAAIGTSTAIGDQTALEFALTFYQALVENGLPLQEAFHLAQARQQASHAKIQDLYQRSSGRVQAPDRLPWELIYQPGAEATAGRWDLPSLAGDELFGLPNLPQDIGLPNEPYQFLRRYERQDAAVFFGRNRFIRKVYNAITAAYSPSILLLQGPSGVGKSSLLYAGVLPRLEQDYAVVYLRRDPAIGLEQGLLQALKTTPESEAESAQRQAEIQSLEKLLADIQTPNTRLQIQALIEQLKAPASANTSLAACWRQREKALKKPLVIILDQVEEAFTRPLAQGALLEMEGLCSQLKAVFSQNEVPQGKLVLGYRKEYHSEVQNALQVQNLPYIDILLERLTAPDLKEIIQGLQSSEKLRQKYQLDIEPGLAEQIIADLLQDPDSPVAPLLQIILTEMWRLSEGTYPRRFSLAHYHTLTEKGIYLEDFFRRQMAEIKIWEKEVHQQVESSGLALDLLHYHTTDYSTAEARGLEALRKKYEHQSEVLDALIKKFQELYLLTAVDGQTSALAHDTLAPVVQKAIRESDKPGQRALRILETKTREYLAAPLQTYIDPEDLALVEAGQNGMRLWVDKERELVAKSRERRQKLEAERQRTRQIIQAGRWILGAAAVAILFFALHTWRQNGFLEGDRLFNEGALLVEKDANLGYQKMQKGLEKSRDKQSKRQRWSKIWQQYLPYENTLAAHKKGLRAATVSSNGTLALAQNSQWGLNFYHAGQNRAFYQYDSLGNEVQDICFAAENRVFVACLNRKVYEIELNKGLKRRYEGQYAPRKIAVSPNAEWLAVAYAESEVLLWNLKSQQKIELQIEDPQALTFGASDQLFIGNGGGELWTFDLKNPKPQLVFRGIKQPVSALVFAKNKKQVILGSESGRLYFLNALDGYKVMAAEKMHEGAVSSLAISPDGRYLLSAGKDGSAGLLDLEDFKKIHTLAGGTTPLLSANWEKNGDFIQTIDQKGQAKRWHFYAPQPKALFPHSSDPIIGITGRAERRVFASMGGYIWVSKPQSEQFDSIYIGSMPFGEPWPMALSADGNVLFYLKNTGTLEAFDLGSKKVRAQTQVPIQLAFKLMTLGDNTVVLASPDSVLLKWEWQTKNPVQKLILKGHEEIAGLGAWNQEKELLVATFDAKMLRLDLSKFSVTKNIDLGFRPADLQVAPDGKKAWLIDQNQSNLLTWDGQKISKSSLQGSKVAFGEDGTLVLAPNKARQAIAAFGANGVKVQGFQNPGAVVEDLQIAHQQKRLLAMIDGQAWTWTFRPEWKYQ